MFVIRGEAGIALIEVSLAAVLATTVVVSLSMAFPLASKSIESNRERLIANNVAAAEIQKYKNQPYALVDVNDLNSAGLNPSCDCSLAGFSVLGSTAATVSGKTYQVTSCATYVKRVGGVWTSQCADSGSKEAVVNVSWQGANGASVIKQESLLCPS